MKNSVGKDVAREYYWLDFIPNCLSQQEITSGHHLVLLGENTLEIELSDKLKIPRPHISSVEHKFKIFEKQDKQKLGISLYLRDVVDFLFFNLHQNQAFVNLALDIEGSFLNNTEKKLYTILLYCWRYPNTVVATYSTIGRDKLMINEGIKSLLTLLWLAPQETISLVNNYFARYEKAGRENSIKLVLRDLFWIRSHVEHILYSTAIINPEQIRSVTRFVGLDQLVWKKFISSKPKKYHLNKIASTVWDIVEKNITPDDLLLVKSAKISISPKRMTNLIYRSYHKWSQRGYFVNFVSHEEQSFFEWIKNFLILFNSSRLIDINAKNKKIIFDHIFSANSNPEIIPSRKAEFFFRYFIPRALDPISQAQTVEIRQIINSIQSYKQGRPMQKIKKVVICRNGNLTEKGIEKVKKLIGRGFKTAEIMEQLPPNAPMATVRAMVAVANRKSKKQFMRSGKLTEYGKNKIRELAKRGLKTKEIARQVPASVSFFSIRSFVAHAND